MEMEIRAMRDTDLDPIVELSLLAWAPVFDSLRNVMGPVLAERLFPDWRTSQEEAVRMVCTEPKYTTLVAVVDGAIAGFLSYELNRENNRGETQMLAVHPQWQNEGVGVALNLEAIKRMKEAGMTIAVVETGGDPGHAPARACYEKAGYTLLPIARYFMAL